jgi:hypothetical protein
MVRETVFSAWVGPILCLVSMNFASSARSLARRCAVLSYSWPRKDNLSSSRLLVVWKHLRCCPVGLGEDVYCVLRACRKVDSRDMIMGRRAARMGCCILLAWEGISDSRLETSFSSAAPLVFVCGWVNSLCLAEVGYGDLRFQRLPFQLGEFVWSIPRSSTWSIRVEYGVRQTVGSSMGHSNYHH